MAALQNTQTDASQMLSGMTGEPLMPSPNSRGPSTHQEDSAALFVDVLLGVLPTLRAAVL